jgi:hypothetical protein
MLRKFSAIALVCLFSLAVFAQGARKDDYAIQMGSGSFLFAIPSAKITVCGFPASGNTSTTACTNKATTYTDQTLVTPCSTSTQVVLAGTTSCVANADLAGNYGFWAAPAAYSISVCTNASQPQCYTESVFLGVGYNSSGAAFLPTGVIAPACNDAAIRAAIVVSNAVPGGIVDISGCTNTITITTSVALGAVGGPGTILKTGVNTFQMGANTITVNRGSKIKGPANQATTFSWTGDVDGILTPAGTSTGLNTFENLNLSNSSLATANNAVLHLKDCQGCEVRNVTVSFDSSAASAGIRMEAVTSNAAGGVWGNTVENNIVQRVNQSGRATSGQIGIDLKGNSGITNGNVSKNVFINNHIEGNTVNFQIFCGSNNKIFGRDMMNGAPSVAITGNGGCNSQGNTFDTELNGTGTAGSQAYTIDSNSSFNRIFGTVDQNLVASTDTSQSSWLSYSTGSNNGNINFSNNGPTSNFYVRPSSARGNLPVPPVNSVIDWMDNGDNMWSYNWANQGVQHVPLVNYVTGSAYTNNNSANFTNISAFFFNVAANTNYHLSCKIFFQGTATTAGPQFKITGPSSPTAMLMAVGPFDPIGKTTTNVTSGFGTANTTLGTIGAGSVNYEATLDMTLINGVNSGGVQVQAAPTGAGTLTIQIGSWCRIQ